MLPLTPPKITDLEPGLPGLRGTPSPLAGRGVALVSMAVAVALGAPGQARAATIRQQPDTTAEARHGTISN